MREKLTVGIAGLILLTGCAGTMPDLGINNGRLMPCPKTPNESLQLSLPFTAAAPRSLRENLDDKR